MSVTEIIFLSLALAFDAFLVSLSFGLKKTAKPLKNAIYIAWGTALFQFIMPYFGALFTNLFIVYIQYYATFFAGGIFIILGTKILFDKQPGETQLENTIQNNLDTKTLLLISFSTSIDALAAGSSLHLLNVNLINATILIGTITFIMSVLGFSIGETIKQFNKNAPDLLNKSGALILILLGIKTIFL